MKTHTKRKALLCLSEDSASQNMESCALYHDKRPHVTGDCGRPMRTHLPNIVLVRLVLPVIAASVMRRHDGEAAHGALGPLRPPGLRLRMVTRMVYYLAGQTSQPVQPPRPQPPRVHRAARYIYVTLAQFRTTSINSKSVMSQEGCYASSATAGGNQRILLSAIP
jgi:hypothetical protein